MQAVHDAGTVHGSLRPESVLVARGREGAERVYVLDLGLAAVVGGAPRAASGRQTPAEPGVCSATAPEQLVATAVPDLRVDVYAAGAILYELVTGQPPFVARARRALVDEIERASPLPARTLRPDLPDDVGAILATALAADRDDRFRSMAGLAAALSLIE
jgi:eukaryotic-like serine/threonine-protein kinase